MSRKRRCLVKVGRYASYLREPEDASPLHGTELPTRGAAWSFLRYIADRRDSSEAEFWKSLIDSGETGYSNRLRALGASPLAWMHNWAREIEMDTGGNLEKGNSSAQRSSTVEAEKIRPLRSEGMIPRASSMDSYAA